MAREKPRVKHSLAEMVLGRGSALLVSAIKGAVKGMLRSIFTTIGKERVKLFIDNDWHVLEVILNAFSAPRWRYPESLSPEEIQRLENIRRRLGPAVRMTLQMVRAVARQLPRAMIQQLDGGWLLRRIREIDPELAKIIESHPKGLKWLDEEARRLRQWLLS